MLNAMMATACAIDAIQPGAFDSASDLESTCSAKMTKMHATAISTIETVDLTCVLYRAPGEYHTSLGFCPSKASSSSLAFFGILLVTFMSTQRPSSL